MTTYAERYYRDKLFDLVNAESAWLDVGCGHQLLPWWLKQSEEDQERLSRTCKELVGIDAVEADVAKHRYLHRKVVGNILQMPFAPNSFNLLTARSVAEHIEDPANFLSEIFRVLTPGGRFLFATPNYWYYQCWIASMLPDFIKQRTVKFLEGRDGDDVFKTHYRFNTLKGIQKLAGETGFLVDSLDTVECAPEFGRMGAPAVAVEKAITGLLRREVFHAWRAVIVGVLRRPEEFERGAERASRSQQSSRSLQTQKVELV